MIRLVIEYLVGLLPELVNSSNHLAESFGDGNMQLLQKHQ